VQKKTNIEFQF